MENNWKKKFDKQFGDKFNNVEGNSKIVATGIGLTYIFSFIESLLAEQKKELMESLTNDLQHETYCRVKGELYKECALCYIERKLKHYE